MVTDIYCILIQLNTNAEVFDPSLVDTDTKLILLLCHSYYPIHLYMTRYTCTCILYLLYITHVCFSFPNSLFLLDYLWPILCLLVTVTISPFWIIVTAS